MEPVSFRPVQSGMRGYYSFFLPLLQQTPDPKLDTYDDHENGDYNILIIYIICVIPIFNYVCNAGWLKSVQLDFNH